MAELTLRQNVYEYVNKKYKSDIEYLWHRYPNYAVFRHADNKKWYGLIMDIPRYKLGLDGQEYVDILNVKMEDLLFRDMLIQTNGHFRGYHISNGNWISVLLDGTVELEHIYELIDISFKATASKQTKRQIRPPKEWLVPANPKYYNIDNAFDNEKIIDWKQSGAIKKGDTVFMYVTAPISAIIYKCKVVESDIPYNYEDENLSIKKIMRIEFIKRYNAEKFTLDVLKKEYGICAVRGQRGIPSALSNALNK